MNPGPDFAGEYADSGRRPGVATQWSQRQQRQSWQQPHAMPDASSPVMDDEPIEPAYVRRHGLMAWWLDLTAPPLPNRVLPISERERLRKAELTSYSILAIFCFLIALVSNSLASPSTGEAVGLMAVGLLIAGVLNRLGKTRSAAYLIPSLMMLVIALAIVGNRAGLDLILVRAYDLFVLPIFLTSLIGDRKAPWIFALVAIAFIVGDFSVQHHALTTGHGAIGFDTIQYEINAVSWWGAINRSVALAIFAAFFGWLGARSVDNAIARADTAEELAALEHTVAQQRRQLETGVQQILETHVRVANGDFSARAPMNQDNLLWQIAASLNNLLGRLQKAGQAEHQYRRTEDEMRRLAAAIDDVQAGRHPIWPALAGTPADLIIERLAGRGRRPSPPMPATGGQPIPPMDGKHGSNGLNGMNGMGRFTSQRNAGMPGAQSPVPPPPFPMPGASFHGAPSFRLPSFRTRNNPPPQTVSSVPESGPLGPLTGCLAGSLDNTPGSNRPPASSEPRVDENSQNGQSSRRGQNSQLDPAADNPWLTLPDENEG